MGFERVDPVSAPMAETSARVSSNPAPPAPPSGLHVTPSHRRFAWVVLFGSLALTSAATAAIARAARTRSLARFETAVHTSLGRIDARMAAYSALLRGTSGLFADGRPVALVDFRAHVERLQLATDYPGIRGVGFSPRVPDGGHDDLVSKARAEGLDGFVPWRDDGRPARFTILYLEPLDTRNRAALGFDMSSEPARWAAMERARDTGAPALSRKVLLKQEVTREKQSGFLLYVPLYHGTSLPVAVAERRERLVGFVYAPFRADDLFRGIFEADYEPFLSFTVFDGEGTAPADVLHVNGGDPGAAAVFRTDRRLLVAGRPWTVSFAGLPGFVPLAERGLPYGMALAGAFVSFALFGLTRAQGRAREEAEASDAARARALEHERAARKEAQDTTALLDALFRTTPAGLAFLDTNLRFLRLNQALAEMNGVGSPPGTKAPAEKLGLANRDELLGVLATGEPLVVETVRPLSETSDARALLAHYARVTDPEGNVLGLSAAVLDITSRRAMEAALRASEARLRRLFEAPLLGVAISTRGGVVVDANDRFLSRLGYDRDALREGRLTWAELVSPEQRSVLSKLWSPRPDGAPHPPTELELSSADGRRVPMLVASARLPDAPADEIVTFALDTTAQKRLERDLDRFFALSPDMLCIVSFDGHLRRFNPAFVKTLGWSDEELANRAMTELVHPDERAAFEADLGALAVASDMRRFEHRYRTRDGAYRWLAWSVSPESAERFAYAVVHDVTERRAQLETLSAREEQLRVLIENIPDIAFSARADGSVDYFNRRFYEYTGLGFEDAQGWRWRALHDPAWRDLVLAEWRRAVALGEPFEMEFPLLGADGVDRWFLTRVRPLRDGDEIVRWFGTSTNVDARRKLEAERERLLAVLEQSSDLIAMATPEGRIVYMNEAGRRLAGLDDASLGTLRELVPAEDGAFVDDVMRAALRSTGAWHGELRLARRDGTRVPVDCNVFLTREAGQARPVGVAMVVRNVTEKKRAERALAEEAERLDVLYRVGRELSAELDLDKLVSVITEAAAHLSGADAAALVYIDPSRGPVVRSVPEREPPPRGQLDEPASRIQELPTRVVLEQGEGDDLRAGKVATFLPLLGHEGPTTWRSVLAVPVPARGGAPGGALVLARRAPNGFSEGATKLVAGLAAQAGIAVHNARLFLDATRLIGALERSNRELDQFAYVASHDLKAPLRAIDQLSSWIEEALESVLTDEARRHMTLLRARVRRLDRLVGGILSYSRAGRAEGIPEPVDVARLVADVVELLAPPPGARIVVQDGLPTLMADRVPLQQVFLNLVGNALKYARRPDPVVRIGAREMETAWEIAVADNGPGIPVTQHERIWEMFQTLEARDKVESTGIGLSVVRKIVEGHGGRAWVESTPGEGATFRFTWPKATGALA